MKTTPRKAQSSSNSPLLFTPETKSPDVTATRLGRVRCTGVGPTTDPAFRADEVYDLIDIICYGPITFFRAGNEDEFEAESFAGDFEIVEVGAQAASHRRSA